MEGCCSKQWSRRTFLGGLALAGSAAWVGLQQEPADAEPPPETTRIRLGQSAAICIAHEYLAQELLPGEGFTEVHYVKIDAGLFTKALVAGEIDITMNYVAPLLLRVDVGDPIVLLAGGQVGCFELVGTDRVRAIRDLKGKTVAVVELGDAQHVFLASMLAYVGLDPRTDVTWVLRPFAEATRLLAEGRIDALLAFPPQPQELRAKHIGHVLVNSTRDRPWSQYFCCMVYANREFVRKFPVATKRALRAIVKAADICGREPERVARYLVDKGYTPSYDYAIQAMKDVVYDKWREYSPEDTLRFYALRLREVGMIKSSPQQIIARGTDWRFLNELKRELKA